MTLKNGAVETVDTNVAGLAQVDTSGINDDEKLVMIWLSEKAPATQKNYSVSLKQFFALVPKPLNEISIADVQNWKNWLGSRFKTSTANNKLTAVKSLMSFALRIGYINVNPASVIKSLKQNNNKEKQSKMATEKIITNDDIKAMIANAANQRNALIVKVGYYFGLRIAELINLHHDDISATPDGNYQLKITGKGGKIRFNNMPKSLYEEICELNNDGYVFQSNRNKKLSRTMAHYIIKDCAKRAGLNNDISAHYLRHCHASHSLNNGASLKSVQKQLGHSSIAITSVYLHDSESSSNYIQI